MTVTNQTNSASFTGDGTNSALSFAFPFIDAADLKVTSRLIATGVETVLALAAHYTVTGGNFASGSVTPVNGVNDFPSTVTWTVERVTPSTQSTDYVENDDFAANTHEEALDKLTILAIDRQGQLDRALKVPVSDSDPGELPNTVDRASKFPGFDAAGDPVALASPTDTAIVTAFMETVLDDGDAATARATLGVEQIGLPRSYLAGLTITRTSSTEFNVGKGVARGGSSSDQDIAGGTNTNAAFGKLFDNGGWDSGDGGGGVPTGAGFAAAIDTWHFFMLIKQDGTAHDFGWDTSVVAANLIADSGVTAALGAAPYFRRIHSFVSTATPNFADFTQTGDEITLNTPVLDYDDVTNDISSGISVTLASIPDGIRVKALIRFSHLGAVNDPLQIRSSDEADVSNSDAVQAPLGAWVNSAAATLAGYQLEIFTNSSQQIFIRKADSTTDTYIVTRGWIDRRGRDD